MQPGKRRRGEEIPEGLADEYATVKSSTKLAEKYGVERKSIVRWLRQLGVPIQGRGGNHGRPAKPKPPPKQIRRTPINVSAETLKAKYQGGATITQLAEKYHKTPKKVSAMLRAIGVEIISAQERARRKAIPIPSNLAEDYAVMGTHELAEKHGVGPPLVLTWLAEKGIPTRPRGKAGSRLLRAAQQSERPPPLDPATTTRRGAVGGLGGPAPGRGPCGAGPLR